MPSDRRHIVRATFERRQRNRANLARLGWHEILSDEVKADPLFDDFFTRFLPDGLRDIPMPRSSAEPCTTWDVSHATKLPVESQELSAFIADLHEKCLAVLKSAVFSTQPWFVVENRDCVVQFSKNATTEITSEQVARVADGQQTDGPSIEVSWHFVEMHAVPRCLLYTSPSPRDRG